MSAKLPSYEIRMYFFIWSAAVAYSFYNVYQTSNVIKQHLGNESNFVSQWKYFTSHKKDASDYEWERFLQLSKYSVPWLIISIIISELLRQIQYLKIIPIWQIVISMLFIHRNFGLHILMVILMQPMLFEIFAKFQRKSAIWICAGVNFCLYNFLEPYIFELEAFNYMPCEIIIPGIFWMKLRCLSIYIDKLEEPERNISFVNVLAYCFYLPFLIMGPFVSYGDFEKSSKLNSTKVTQRLTILVLNTMRFVWWSIILEILLHFVYINSISQYPELVLKMDNWTLYGFGYCMGQFFHIKYVVFYGLTTTLAKFENVVVPNIPKCIGRIHLYSDMWKYFDQGLYRFLLKYVYLPSRGSKTTMRKLLSSMISFGFVYVWHGLEKFIFIWAFLNFFGITIETICADLYKQYFQLYFEKYLTPEWRRRAFCMLASPLLGLSAISNFYFFSNMEVGNIFLGRYLSDSFIPTIILLGILYCTSQVSTEVKEWEKESRTKKQL